MVEAVVVVQDDRNPSRIKLVWLQFSRKHERRALNLEPKRRRLSCPGSALFPSDLGHRGSKHNARRYAIICEKRRTKGALQQSQWRRKRARPTAPLATWDHDSSSAKWAPKSEAESTLRMKGRHTRTGCSAPHFAIGHGSVECCSPIQTPLTIVAFLRSVGLIPPSLFWNTTPTQKSSKSATLRDPQFGTLRFVDGQRERGTRQARPSCLTYPVFCTWPILLTRLPTHLPARSPSLSPFRHHTRPSVD